MAEERLAACLKGWGVSGSDGQTARVARRLALIGVCGEIARLALDLPWDEGETERAARACFESWRAARGGGGPGEIQAAREVIRQAIERHGESRFVRIHDEALTGYARPVVRDLLGYRFQLKDELIWGFTATGWRDTLRHVADPKLLARELGHCGVLEITPSEADRHQLSRKIDGRRQRLYAVRASALEETEA